MGCLIGGNFTGRCSSVGSALGSQSCVMQHGWFDPFLSRGDFSLGVNMGCDTIPWNSFRWEYKPSSCLWANAFHCTDVLLWNCMQQLSCSLWWKRQNLCSHSAVKLRAITQVVHDGWLCKGDDWRSPVQWIFWSFQHLRFLFCKTKIEPCSIEWHLYLNRFL